MRRMVTHELRPRRLVIVAAAVLAPLVVVLVFHAPLLARFGHWLVETDEPAPADVIIVLGGQSGHRIVKGRELYAAGLAERIAITGPNAEYPEFEEPTYVRWLHLLDRVGMPEDRIDLLSPSNSTFDDAVLVRDYLHRTGHRSALVVTDPYHTKRAGWVIRRMLAGTSSGDESAADDLEIRVVACDQPWFAPDRWWKDEKQLLFVVLEYVKFGYYVASYGRSGPLQGTPTELHRASPP